ncbi:hypothetical protein B0I72DRAFT_133824 [Yarrowia lipolytica]|uniref:Secreted protein n=1 Tax=Yarrowia lipolytica TaxID=4952 RepID=A0A371CE37_YARLL|nr:hypothetical protein BKA91DRAFT_135748 [Yarrowia lipolytica]KAE8173685.1 hypothetical protein BKA90DRAFT_135381 [Yarrowia lipolytica]RDW28538.1 hypothetical protein B0I71DRAFT_127224 [Yarrowia lipolytica]RDW34943.1 hypothetical protein B0I72DRAFT_133824 [Yarrowia lipolytica]RDW42711.1 hypothetical protein B0I73DRAFT_126585 [Yarrowia lipolytica]
MVPKPGSGLYPAVLRLLFVSLSSLPLSRSLLQLSFAPLIPCATLSRFFPFSFFLFASECRYDNLTVCGAHASVV